LFSLDVVSLPLQQPVHPDTKHATDDVYPVLQDQSSVLIANVIVLAGIRLTIAPAEVAVMAIA
jgi:hypothetical protein